MQGSSNSSSTKHGHSDCSISTSDYQVQESCLCDKASNRRMEHSHQGCLSEPSCKHRCAHALAAPRMQASLPPAAAATMLLLEHQLMPLVLCQSINTLMQKYELHTSRSSSHLLSLAILVSAFLSTETGTMLPRISSQPGQAFNSTCQVGL